MHVVAAHHRPVKLLMHLPLDSRVGGRPQRAGSTVELLKSCVHEEGYIFAEGICSETSSLDKQETKQQNRK
jgi:hypothetical protein